MCLYYFTSKLGYSSQKSEILLKTLSAFYPHLKQTEGWHHLEKSYRFLGALPEIHASQAVVGALVLPCCALTGVSKAEL